MNKNYNSFLERRDKTLYVSKVAEYKRSIFSKINFYVPKTIEESFKFIINEITQSDQDNMATGISIKDKNSDNIYFITEFKNDSIIRYEEERTDGFYWTEYKFKKHRTNGTTIFLTIGMKLKNRTRVGLNGQLASFLWKRNTSKLLYKAKQLIQKNLK